MSNNYFRAPQKQLKSSFPQISFTKAKNVGIVIKKSIGSRPTAIIKDRGLMATSSTSNSNMY
jgi:hypothetical protein